VVAVVRGAGCDASSAGAGIAAATGSAVSRVVDC
jgi:hypothetical protein